MRAIQLTREEMLVPDFPANDGRTIYIIEGPLSERTLVETPWGEAWAEVGMYMAEDEDTGAQHIVHPDDLTRLYRELP